MSSEWAVWVQGKQAQAVSREHTTKRSSHIPYKRSWRTFINTNIPKILHFYSSLILGKSSPEILAVYLKTNTIPHLGTVLINSSKCDKAVNTTDDIDLQYQLAAPTDHCIDLEKRLLEKDIPASIVNAGFNEPMSGPSGTNQLNGGSQDVHEKLLIQELNKGN